MNIPFVDLKAQYTSLKPEMDAAIQSVLDRAAFILGPEVVALERTFAEYVGVKHAVPVGSGTDALRLALEALGIGSGDEVITVANTYIATCEAITHVELRSAWWTPTPVPTTWPWRNWMRKLEDGDWKMGIGKWKVESG